MKMKYIGPMMDSALGERFEKSLLGLKESSEARATAAHAAVSP